MDVHRSIHPPLIQSHYHTHKSDDWRSFFEVIIVSAGKPGFFTSDRPFRSVAQATGKIRCVRVCVRSIGG